MKKEQHLKPTYKILKDKPAYKSATVWGGIAMGAYAIYRILNGQPVDIETIKLIAGAFGLVGIRRALSEIING